MKGNLNYREINVWIFAIQLSLPLFVAEAVTHYATQPMTISTAKVFPALHDSILYHLDNYRFKQTTFGPNPIQMNMIHGLLPWRIFTLPEGRKQLRYLFGCNEKGKVWFLMHACQESQIEDIPIADDNVAEYWKEVKLFNEYCMWFQLGFTICSYAHVDVGKITRIICFQT